MRKLLWAVAVVGLAVGGCEQRGRQGEQGRAGAGSMGGGTTEQEGQTAGQGGAGQAGQQQGQAGQQGQQQQVSGRVQQAERNSLVLIVPEQDNQQVEFRANPQTRVTRGSEQVTITDLEPGDMVRATYVMQGDQLVLQSITVQE